MRKAASGTRCPPITRRFCPKGVIGRNGASSLPTDPEEPCKMAIGRMIMCSLSAVRRLLVPSSELRGSCGDGDTAASVPSMESSMGRDDRRKSQLAKLALKIGTVATAAAALLSEGTARPIESDFSRAFWIGKTSFLPSHLRRRCRWARTAAAHPEAEACGAALDTRRTSVALVAQLTQLTRLREQSLLALLELRPEQLRRRSSRGSSTRSTDHLALRRLCLMSPTPATPPLRVAPKPAPTKVKAASRLDIGDPKVRYELLRLQEFQGLQKAYIMDHSVESASLVKVGEPIGDCTLIEILPKTESIRLKPSEGPAFTVTRGQPTK